MATIRELIDDQIVNMGVDGVFFFDGFDDAIIGLATTFNTTTVAYSYEKIIEILMQEVDMTLEDALDHFGFNIAGSYVGEGTPTIVQLDFT